MAGLGLKLALAAFGTADESRPHVADPEGFVAARSELVLRMSDQVPFWVMIQASRQLYAEGELRKLGQKNKDPPLRQMTGQTHASQKLRIEDEDWHEADEPVGHEGMDQARGQGISEQDRYRITSEACQEVHDYSKGPAVEPKQHL